ncbi:hypothetical protein [Xenorhabdus littoralis]|nr:hypothetical protein [Xenorhabdus sp. Reich]
MIVAHTHHNTGTPENASAIRNTASKSDGLKWAEKEIFACDWMK